MSHVYFISDLHFGHKKVLTFENNFRSKVLGGITDIQEHDDLIIERCNRVVKKNDLLYVLGDLGNYTLLDKIRCQKKIVLGNHDKYNINKYLQLKGIDIVGVRKYKGFWVDHTPMHPLELFGHKNIHGHVHSKSILSTDYINVCVEMTCGFPIKFDYIKDGSFTTYDKRTPEQVYDQVHSVVGVNYFWKNGIYEGPNHPTN